MSKHITGLCALCREPKELQLSHIIPHFVGRKLKKTSPGNIRVANEPNKVAQDIEKHYLLCHDCEELFSASETWFAKNLFNPFQDKIQTQFPYDENLTYFIISLSWRSLYLDLSEFSCDPSFDKDRLLLLLHAEQIMREFLLGKRHNLESIENHVFFFDRIQSVENIRIEQNPSVAMHRSLSSYTAYNGNTTFTVSNLMGIMIVTFYSMDENEKWVRTKVEIGTGMLEAKNQDIQSVVGNEIEYWMQQAIEANANLSEKQKQRIMERFSVLGEDIKKYPIYQDWTDDALLK